MARILSPSCISELAAERASRSQVPMNPLAPVTSTRPPRRSRHEAAGVPVRTSVRSATGNRGQSPALRVSAMDFERFDGLLIALLHHFKTNFPLPVNGAVECLLALEPIHLELDGA